jgi:hypothetical protein
MNTGFETSQSNPFLTVADWVSLPELEQGMVNAARLVRRYGAIYWPIVERLQREIDAIENRDALIAKLLDGEAKPANQVNFG